MKPDAALFKSITESYLTGHRGGVAGPGQSRWARRLLRIGAIEVCDYVTVFNGRLRRDVPVYKPTEEAMRTLLAIYDQREN